MSEWVDFTLYVTLIVLIFVLLPRHGRRFTVPMIAERNAEWLAHHRDLVASLERSRWFLNACYGWAAVSIAVLLGAALDLIAAPLGAEAPKWDVMKDLNGLLLIGGLLGWGVCSLLWVRWLGAHVPLAETRRATLKRRVVGDYLALPWRAAVEAVTALHLCAWIVSGALGFGGGAKFWSSFAFFVAMSALFAGLARLAPRRRPGYLDRVFGDAYRRVEVRLAYFIRLWPVIIGVIALAELITGAELARAAQLLIVAFVCVLALMLLRLRPIAPTRGTPLGYGTSSREGHRAA